MQTETEQPIVGRGSYSVMTIFVIVYFYINMTSHGQVSALFLLSI